MQFLYDEQSGNESIELKSENFKYLIKVRRHKENDKIVLRHPTNTEEIFIYSLQNIESKRATLILQEKKRVLVMAKKSIHLAWCIIDIKSVEKVLAMLNEIGIAKITFIYCERSQSNVKINLARLQRILRTSSMQCGRSELMKLDISNNLDTFLHKNPNTCVVDFNQTKLHSDIKADTFLIGCEGGFSNDEHKKFTNFKIAGLDSDMILRSESAAVAVASKMLL